MIGALLSGWLGYTEFIKTRLRSVPALYHTVTLVRSACYPKERAIRKCSPLSLIFRGHSLVRARNWTSSGSTSRICASCRTRGELSTRRGALTNRFPGSQPVSFSKQSVDKLLRQEYDVRGGLADSSFWVCEKSDGQRVLMLIVVPQTTGIQEIYLVRHTEGRGSSQINRKNHYYRIENLVMPVTGPGGESLLRNHTILDGELVIDEIAANQVRSGRSGVLTRQRKLRLLLFDCVVIDGVSMADRPLGRRYAV